MKLKKLEVIGFKSFARKTEFHFGDGVTAIVGPNGCGKSNIVDAVNWVLGTLSSKLVRGEEMADVIFKGSQGHPPMGFAQVSLTLDNSDHVLPVPYEEVTVARKLYRSGESEYLINKALVRLKDIKEMFLNTGLGVDNYSVIEQGKIESLVLSSSRQRRHIFDEAAGISKYKVKRKEAKSKLERVQQDLVRLEDLLKEIERELHSVRIQAGRARKFDALKLEYREKRVRFYLHEYKELLARSAENARERERLLQAQEERARQRKEAGAGAQRAEEALQRDRERLQELEIRRTELTGMLKQAEDALERSEKERAELRRQKMERAKELRALQRKAADLRPELPGMERKLERLDRNAERIAAILKGLEEQVREAREAVSEVEQQADAKQAEAFDVARKDAAYRTEKAEIEAAIKSASYRMQQIDRNLEKAEADLQKVQMQLDTAEGNREAIARSVQANQQRRRELEELRSRLEADLEKVEETLQGLRKERETCSAGRETLLELESRGSGIEQGSRELLQLRPEGLRGVLADLLDVDPEYAACIDAILRDLQGYIVAENLNAALDGLRRVKENRWGGAGFILLGDGAETATLHPERREEGVIGRAGEFLRVTDPEVERAVATVFNRYLVVQDLGTARRLLEGGLREPIVTLDGIVIDPPRIEMAPPNRHEKSLLARRAQLARLEARLKKLDQEIRIQEQRRTDLRRRNKAVAGELESIRRALYDRQVELRSVNEEIESGRERERFCVKEIEHQKGERAAVAREIEEQRRRESRILEMLEELNRQRARTDREVGEIGRLKKRYADALKKLEERLKFFHVCQGTVRVKREEVKQRLEKSFETLRELTERQGALEDQLEDLERLVRESEGRARESEAAAGKARAAIGALEAEGRSLAERLARREAEAREAREAVEALEKAMRGFDERKQALDLKANELRLTMENLEARAREDVEMELRERAGRYVEDPDADWDGLRAEVDRLRNRIASFGAVNMLALERLKELEERDRFSREQRRDLLKTKEELEDFIDRVNQESHARFKATIDVVRKHFNDVFRKIFGGGKAEIEVENEPDVDPLDQGIEVKTRLPKKEVTKLSLMSGGEKSLTAIALTLALFRARPTAFCILDECDASLDEANVQRYSALLKEFSKDTQFIVITHNKRTMMVADKLYGITMQPPGVSRRVAVSFERAKELAES